MRNLLLLLCTAGLFAASPLRVVAVERQGLPPYEDEQRIYRLQGSTQVKPGELLELTRSGGRTLPGRLRVLSTTRDGILATLERRGDTYPMKGDVALHWELATLPGLAPIQGLAEAPALLGPTLTVPREPRTLWEALYFLPGDATLSPLGRAKLETWVREFGAGQWTLEVPTSKGAVSRLYANRAKALKAALAAAGVKGLQTKAVALPPGQRAEAIFVRYQERPAPKVSPSRKA